MDDKKGLVIDPYCGSGTTLVAAKILGHDFLGVEISTEYIEITENRLNHCENERKVVNSELGKHIVRKTFTERKQNGEYTGRFKNKKNSVKEEQMPIRLLEPKTQYMRRPKKASPKKNVPKSG